MFAIVVVVVYLFQQANKTCNKNIISFTKLSCFTKLISVHVMNWGHSIIVVVLQE